MSDKNRFTAYGFLVWFLAIGFFFYEYFLRVLPATVAKNMIDSLSLNVDQFALIGSAYFFTYSFMQIPAGLLFDRFSSRTLLATACALCSFATVWLSLSHSFLPAFMSRLLIGAGSAFGYVALMSVTLNWFPKKYFASLFGGAQFFGALGPIAAGAPVILFVNATNGNWRGVFMWIALAGAILTLLIAIFAKDKPRNSNAIVFIDKKEPFSKNLKPLILKAQVWFLIIYASNVYVSLPLLGAFWGPLFLESRGYTSSISALMISMIWLGKAIGSPIFGRISDLVSRRKPVLVFCAALGVSSSLVILLIPHINIIVLGSLFLGIGLSGSAQGLSFVVLMEHAPRAVRGTILGFGNSFLMGFSAILPLFTTTLIQFFAENGVLTTAAFTKGLMIVPITFGVSLAASLFGIRETYCRDQNQIHQLRK